MFEEEIHLRDYLHVIVKWRWIVTLIVVVFVIFATIKAFRQPPLYRATARVIIEKRKPGVIPFGETYTWDNWDTEYLHSQYEIITSRELAKKVLQKLPPMNEEEPVQQEQPKSSNFPLRQYITDVKEFIGISSPPPLSESAKTIQEEDQTADGLLGMVSVQPVEDSRLVDISVTSLDREEAALIANTWVETFVEQNLEAKTMSSKEAVRWLVNEVESTRQKLAESETALQGYREQHEVVSFEDRHSIVMQKLANLNKAVTNARIERLEFEAQYHKIKDYKKGNLATLPRVIENGAIQWMKVELARLESELSEQEGKLRDKHPTIIALRAQVAGQRKEIDAEISRSVDSMKREYEISLAQEEKLTKELEQQKIEALAINQKAITFGILEKEVESNQWVYDTLLQKMKELSIAERLETNNIRIVDRATIPSFPFAPNRQRSIMLAAIASLVLGISLAFFLEYLDNSFKVPEEITQVLDIPFLGIIPQMATEHLLPAKGTEHVAETIVATAPKSIVSEAYRSLRTSVTFSALQESSSLATPGLVLLVTSSEPSEGKSCTVANLAIAMAQSGKKTLIIDCDFRKPVMHQIFDVSPDRGFADALSIAKAHNAKRYRGSIKRTKVPNLHVLPCGTIPPDPSELLSSSFAKKAIERLSQQYDAILLDSPPVNSVTDSVILSNVANAVLLVIRAGKTKRDLAKRTRDQLQHAKAPILGGVLNSVDIRKNKYYYYYAYHYPHYYREGNDILPPKGKKKLVGSGI